MTIKIDSTTDTEQAVTSALGGLAEKKVEETSTPESEETSETAEEPEASEETEDEASESEESPEETEESPKDGDEKPKKKNGFKKRIEKLNKRLTERDRELEYLKSEVSKLRTTGEPKPETKAETVANDEPKSDDFESHAAYVRALIKWEANQLEKAKESKRREEQVKSELQAKGKTYRERLETFKADHADFDELMEDVQDIPMSLAVQEALLDSDYGPALAYELAKDPKEYERITRLPAVAAARAIGKIEARLEKASETKTQTKTTKAPPPISTVKPKGEGSTKRPDQMDYQEYKKWREARLKRT